MFSVFVFPLMEMIFEFEEKIHVQKDIHHIIQFQEHMEIYIECSLWKKSVFNVGQSVY
jgi:hypothetical protein